MNVNQELEQTQKELETARAALKGIGDGQKRAQMESKLHWLEGKLEKLRKKQQS